MKRFVAYFFSFLCRKVAITVHTMQHKTFRPVCPFSRKRYVPASHTLLCPAFYIRCYLQKSIHCSVIKTKTTDYVVSVGNYKDKHGKKKKASDSEPAVKFLFYLVKKLLQIEDNSSHRLTNKNSKSALKVKNMYRLASNCFNKFNGPYVFTIKIARHE